jgi:hypothetical protein
MADLTASAQFDQYTDAREALVELRRHFAFGRSPVEVIARSVSHPSVELRIHESDFLWAVLRGALTGAFGGLVAAALGAFFVEEEGWIPPKIETIVFVSIAGFFIGLFSGALLGASNSKWAVAKLRTIPYEKGVVITVGAKNERDRVSAEQILKVHAGQMPAPDLPIPRPHPA